jgi:hypothetical protein
VAHNRQDDSLLMGREEWEWFNDESDWTEEDELLWLEYTGELSLDDDPFYERRAPIFSAKPGRTIHLNRWV